MRLLKINRYPCEANIKYLSNNNGIKTQDAQLIGPCNGQ